MVENLSLGHLIYLLIVISVVKAGDDDWHGGWFPYAPDVGTDPNPVFTIRKNMYDPKHGVVMGVKDPHCDDAKTNLEIDWDYNPVNHSCFIFNRRQFFESRSDIHPVHSQDYIPKSYSAPHKCMSESINYNVIVPTFGTHRPLWAKYGEYKFLPRQRWVHNLEHGAVVMLYHPCADKNEVNFLRKLVKKCLYRHVITPYNLLSAQRPLALVTWGHRLEMSKVAPKIVVDFIRKHALKGPEHTARDGQYDLMLEEHSEVVSDLKDQELCKGLL
ncbi:uncharacterized protein LOC123015176 [Tribolium madens]|uniref:uncharacterized protein LOC123015176 n=1 Tax=Tribolium madens TaxID=41895 RepID=UPI001CF742C4|nr:uncharacterized protein LOC123015176 [Tribolium madens]